MCHQGLWKLQSSATRFAAAWLQSECRINFKDCSVSPLNPKPCILAAHGSESRWFCPLPTVRLDRNESSASVYFIVLPYSLYTVAVLQWQSDAPPKPEGAKNLCPSCIESDVDVSRKKAPKPKTNFVKVLGNPKCLNPGPTSDTLNPN